MKFLNWLLNSRHLKLKRLLFPSLLFLNDEHGHYWVDVYGRHYRVFRLFISEVLPELGSLSARVPLRFALMLDNFIVPATFKGANTSKGLLHHTLWDLEVGYLKLRKV